MCTFIVAEGNEVSVWSVFEYVEFKKKKNCEFKMEKLEKIDLFPKTSQPSGFTFFSRVFNSFYSPFLCFYRKFQNCFFKNNKNAKLMSNFGFIAIGNTFVNFLSIAGHFEVQIFG